MIGMRAVLRILALGTLFLLTQCAAPGEPQSGERIAVRSSALDQPLFVSAEFSVDHVPSADLNPGAPLLDVAASPNAYLFTYAIDGLSFMRWNAASGSSSKLASLPLSSASVMAAHAVPVGNGWLAVYEVTVAGVRARYAVSIASDGTLSTPSAIPGTCSDGIAGLARSISNALLSDRCGGAVLMGLAGELPTVLTLATPGSLGLPGSSGPLNGGQVAFNGIDYLVLYGNSVSGFSKLVAAIAVSPAGAVASPLYIASPSVPYKGVNPLGLAVNGNTFLALFRQGRSSGPETDITYKSLQESAAHEFTPGTEKYLVPPPGSTLQPGDRNATAFAIAERFGIVREDSGRALTLTLLDPSDVLPTTVQPLLDPFVGAPLALTGASSSGFVVAAGPRGVRFDSAIHAFDVPPATIISYLNPAPKQSSPSYSFGAGSYLTSWIEGYQVFVQRLSTGGEIVEPASVCLKPDMNYVEDQLLAADSKGFVSAWRGSGAPTTGGARISSADPLVITPFPALNNGYVIGLALGSDGVRASLVSSGDALAISQFSDTGAWSPSLTIASTPSYRSSNPALAFIASQFVVLWIASSGVEGEWVIYGVRVNQDLTLIDSSPKEILHFSASVPRDLQLAAVGDHLVMAWSAFHTDSESHDAEVISAARLSTSLGVLDPGGIQIATPHILGLNTFRRIALHWDGSNVWLLWLDAAGGSSPSLGTVKGQRFSSTLAPVDATPWLAANDLGSDSTLTLTGGDEGRSLIGYSGWDNVARNFRARARFLSASPFDDGIPCETAAQCQNGVCSAGHCASTGAAGAGGQTGGNGGSNSGNAGTGPSGGSGGTLSSSGSGGTLSSSGSGGTLSSSGSGGALSSGGSGGTLSSGASGGALSSGGSGGALSSSGNGGALSSAGNGGALSSAGNGGVANGGSGAADAGEAGSPLAGSSSDDGDAGSDAESTAGSGDGGAATHGGGAGNSGPTPGNDSCSCSVVGGHSSFSRLNEMLVLAGVLTLVMRRRRTLAAA
jgi:hypothetical protein